MSKSKKNQNQTKTVNEEVVNTEEVVDTTEQLIEGEPVSAETNPEGVKIEDAEGDAVEEKMEVTMEVPASTEVTETPVVEPSVTETSTEPVAEKAEGAEKADESEKDSKPAQAATLSARTSSSDRYGDDIDDGDKDEGTSDDTPVTNPSTPTVTESEEIVDRALMNKELNTAYNVKFTYSEASKRFAISRKMTLLAMYDLFVKNRNAFVGLKSQDDFNHISEFMNKYSVLYNYKEIPKAGKRQFLDKLRSATDYVLLGR